MERRKIRISLILAFLIAAGGLSACSSTEVPDRNHKTEGKVTITYAAGKDASAATMKTIAEFEQKNPDINIEYKELPTQSDVQHDTYFTALSAGDDSMDVLALDMVWTTEFAAAGWLLDLSDRFTPQIQKEFLKGPVASVTYHNKVWAVPRYTDAGILFYRKDILPKAPETWDELIQMCKQNTGKKGTKYGYTFQGLQYEGLVCNALEFIGGNGGQVLSGNKVVIDSPKAVAGFQHMLDLMNQGIAPQAALTWQEEDARNVFQDGQALFMRNWPYAWAMVNKDGSKVKGNVGIAPIPVGRHGMKSAPILGGWNLGINTSTAHPDEAWRFVAYMTGYEGQKIQALDGGNLPSRKALYGDKDVLLKNPYWKEFYHSFVTAVPRPVTPSYLKLTDVLQENFHKALAESVSAKETMKNIKAGMQ